MPRARGLGRLSRLLLVAVAALLVGLAAPPATAGPRPSVTLAVPAKTAPIGTTVTLTGTVTGLVRGRTLIAQVRTSDGSWRTFAAVEAGDDGSFSVDVEPVLGPNAFRVLMKRGRVVLATSPVRRVAGVPAEPTGTGSTSQVSEHGGTEPRVSGDGSVVAYTSLVDDGTSGRPVRTSVFVWDRRSGERREISTGPDGQPADGTSDTPTVSADGRSVAFFSTATNLVAGDDNGGRDLFVWDATTGTLERLTTSPAGVGYAYSAALSADGERVAYTSSAPDVVAGDVDGVADAFLLDRSTGRTTLVSHAAGDDARAVGGSVVALSAAGDRVTFVSASDAVAAADQHPGRDAFVFDAGTGESRLVSDLTAGAELGNVVAASADGQAVAYQEVTGMLVGRAYVWDAGTGERTLLPDPADDGSDRQLSSVASLSADGRYALVGWNTSKGRLDVFRVDRTDGDAVRLNGTEFAGHTESRAYPGSLSDDGRFATFWSVVAPDGRGAESFLWDAQG